MCNRLSVGARELSSLPDELVSLHLGKLERPWRTSWSRNDKKVMGWAEIE